MLEAPWVGKTPEEYRDETEYTINFTMQGSITICARDKEQAKEIFRDMSRNELADYTEDVEIDEVE